MCRRIIQVFTGIFAILFLSLGITTLLIRDKALREDTYLIPLRENQTYSKVISLAIEQNLNTLNPDQALVFNAFKNIITKDNKLQSLVQTTVEKSAGYIFAWLRGEEKDVYIYFPRDEIKQILSKDNLKAAIVDLFDQEYSDYDKLPMCTQAQLDEMGNFDPTTKITCRVPGLETKDALKAEFIKNIDQGFDQFDIDKFLSQNNLNYNQKTLLKTILDSTDKAKSDEILNNFEKFKTNVYFAGIFGLALTVFGVMFTLITLLLTRMTFGNLSKVVLNITIFTGFFIGLLGGLGVVLSNAVLSISTFSVSTDLNLDPDIVKAMLTVVSTILNSVFLPILIIGAITFGVALVVRIIIQFIFQK